MTISFHLVSDSSCGQHGPYAFYRSFEFRAKDSRRTRRISLGEFFLFRFTSNDSVCVGELQLLWEDKNVDRTLTSCRLYYLPENTPEGRQRQHGEDEVLATSDKVVLCAEDLVQRIVRDVRWERGLKGLYAAEEDSESPSAAAEVDHDSPTAAGKPSTGNCMDSAAKDSASSGSPSSAAATSSAPRLVETFIANNNLRSAKKCQPEADVKSYRSSVDPDESTVKVLSFPTYCRYRAVLKRLENVAETWLRNALVVALGGFTVPSRNCRLLFCRDTFEHPLLEGNELLHNHLAPKLKGRPRKKRLKTRWSNSPGSESNESEEGRDILVKEERPRNGLRKELADEDLEEQEFLQRLFKFMRKRNTPIERVPHLGFKQINLYFFYTYAQKLGGYEKITVKKLWKHIYDELGGNPGSTSAATCTRRHYERLLLPFERHAKGEDHKLLPPPPAATTTKCRKNSNASNPPPAPTPSPTHTSLSAQNPPSPSSSTSSARPSSPDSHATCTRKGSVGEGALPSPSPPSPQCSEEEETAAVDDDDAADTAEQEGGDSPPPRAQSPAIPPKGADLDAAHTESDDAPPSPAIAILSGTEGRDACSDSEPGDDRKKLAVPPRPHFQTALPTPQVYQQQRKRAKDEKFAEKERMWDEIRKQNAIERDRIRQLTAAARSANSSRVLKAKDLLPKPMGVVCPLETVPLHCGSSSSSSSSVSPGGGPLTCVVPEGPVAPSKLDWYGSKNRSPIPQASPHCVPCAPVPQLAIKSEDRTHDRYGTCPRPSGGERFRNKRTQYEYPSTKGTRGQFVAKKPWCADEATDAPAVKSEVRNGWRPFKEEVADDVCCGLARPSVIRHTHSAVVEHPLAKPCPSERMAYDGGASLDRDAAEHRNLVSGWNGPPATIPVAHCNSLKSAPRFHPYHGDASAASKCLVAQVSPWPPSVDLGRRPSPSPWASSSPHGRPVRASSASSKANGFAESPSEDEGMALDLSMKKCRLAPSDSPWPSGLVVPARTDADVRELDLSMKYKPKPASSPAPSKGCPFSAARKPTFRNSDGEPVRRRHDATELKYSSCKAASMSPMPAGGHDAASLHVVPSHYYFSDDKAPAFFPDYGQISTLLPPPHYYGLPFPVASPHPQLVPEQLQGGLAAYKELFHKGVFPAAQYPSFAFASHLYPSLYKEQSPYLYLPK